MGKCAWCGDYISDSGDRQMGGEFMNQMGLGFVSKLAGAAIPRYCSKACKQAAKASKSGVAPASNEVGGGETVVVNSGPSAGSVIAKGVVSGYGKMFGACLNALKGAANKKEEQKAAEAEKAASIDEQIANAQFTGSADEVSTVLNDLFVLLAQNVKNIHHYLILGDIFENCQGKFNTVNLTRNFNTDVQEEHRVKIRFDDLFFSLFSLCVPL
ncbi:MAG: hypothetical protein Ta2F_14500 [Termitinemataceae bacterium]|nr:MAG: hypothetical protein Ta2F_14500 [Termitinemataceae bacterium]